MNSVDEGILGVRIEKIRHCGEQLKTLTQMHRDDFVQSAIHCAAAERNLQIAIQAMLDIGAYLLAKTGKGKPEDYKSVFRELGKAGMIPVPFAKTIESLAGLRNILVHEYAEVDPGRLYDGIKRGLGDFEEFTRHIAAASKKL